MKNWLENCACPECGSEEYDQEGDIWEEGSLLDPVRWRSTPYRCAKCGCLFSYDITYTITNATVERIPE